MYDAMVELVQQITDAQRDHTNRLAAIHLYHDHKFAVERLARILNVDEAQIKLWVDPTRVRLGHEW